MRKSNEYVQIYSGSEIAVILLKGLLEEEGIPSIVQSGFGSGSLGDFVGGAPTTVRLKVRECDFYKSMAVVEEFQRNRVSS